MCCDNNPKDFDRVIRLMKSKNCSGRMTFYKSVMRREYHGHAMTAILKCPIYVGWNESWDIHQYDPCQPHGFHVWLSYSLSADGSDGYGEETIPVVCWAKHLLAADHRQAVFSSFLWDGTVAEMTYRNHKAKSSVDHITDRVNGVHVPSCNLSAITGKGEGQLMIEQKVDNRVSLLET